MSHKKLAKEKIVGINTTILITVIGVIGTAITAYFAYLSSTKPTELAISATQTASNFASQYVKPNSPITFLPIPDKDLLVKTFKLEGVGARVNLRFIANNFDIDFTFSAPLEMKCSVLMNNLTQHFALDKYIEVDMSKFSTGGYDGYWERFWILNVNGAAVDDCWKRTLRDMAVTNGDLIGLKIEWALFVPTSLLIIPTTSAGTPTPLPTFTPEPIVRPPDIFP